jgi:hypothetical protein
MAARAAVVLENKIVCGEIVSATLNSSVSDPSNPNASQDVG